ncbi:MAG: putative porin [Planctomycetes bacterium]|nr:putative porin [Planctomycetota bacterium]
MLRKLLMVVLVIGFMAGMVGTAKADEVSELKLQLAEQAELLKQMQLRLEQLETQQGMQEQQMEQQIAKAVEDKQVAALPDSLKWAEKVKLYGDFRYRHEHIDAESDGGHDNNGRDRHRIRARVGVKAQINDEWAFDLRLASGSSDAANSTNQTLDDAWAEDDLWIDRAYLKYTPLCLDDWTFLFGKMGNPFYKPGGSQLLWDGDANPEGIAFSYETKLNDNTGFFANGGGMWMEEQSSDVDTFLWGLQGGLKHTFDSGDKLTWGAGAFKYGNIKDEAILSSAEGNSTSGGNYLYDYELVELFGEYGTKLGNLPLSVYGDYVVNTASKVKEDTGWLVGTKLGKVKDPGTWDMGYEYRDSEKDSVVGMFTDSDFVDGGAEGKGHKFSIGYGLAKNTKLGFTYFLTERDAGGNDKRDDKYQRMQFDLSVKF